MLKSTVLEVTATKDIPYLVRSTSDPCFVLLVSRYSDDTRHLEGTVVYADANSTHWLGKYSDKWLANHFERMLPGSKVTIEA